MGNASRSLKTGAGIRVALRGPVRFAGNIVGVLALASLGACAVGADGGSGGGRADARSRTDAPSGGFPDSSFTFPADGGVLPPVTDSAPASCETGTWTTISTNGNFDAEPIVWKQFSSTGLGIIATENPAGPIVSAPTSPRYAWLGGADDGQDQVYQNVTVPARVAGLRISGTVCVASLEVNTGTFDQMLLTIHDAATQAQLEPALKSWTNDDKTRPCAFANFTVEAASPHGGEDIIVVFGSKNDRSKNTNFFLDSVKVEAAVCP